MLFLRSKFHKNGERSLNRQNILVRRKFSSKIIRHKNFLGVFMEKGPDTFLIPMVDSRNSVAFSNSSCKFEKIFFVPSRGPPVINGTLPLNGDHLRLICSFVEPYFTSKCTTFFCNFRGCLSLKTGQVHNSPPVTCHSCCLCTALTGQGTQRCFLTFFSTGAGGSTLLVIEELRMSVSFDKKKVLLIHAGGWSQRLPFASVLGKLFMPFPSGM